MSTTVYSFGSVSVAKDMIFGWSIKTNFQETWIPFGYTDMGPYVDLLLELKNIPILARNESFCEAVDKAVLEAEEKRKDSGKKKQELEKKKYHLKFEPDLMLKEKMKNFYIKLKNNGEKEKAEKARVLFSLYIDWLFVIHINDVGGTWSLEFRDCLSEEWRATVTDSCNEFLDEILY